MKASPWDHTPAMFVVTMSKCGFHRQRNIKLVTPPGLLAVIVFRGYSIRGSLIWNLKYLIRDRGGSNLIWSSKIIVLKERIWGLFRQILSCDKAQIKSGHKSGLILSKTNCEFSINMPVFTGQESAVEGQAIIYTYFTSSCVTPYIFPRTLTFGMVMKVF